MRKLILTFSTVLFLTLSVYSQTDMCTNVTDYGAIADDGIDDTQAFKDAIIATPLGGQLCIPAGEYDISGEIDLGTNSLRMTGTNIRTAGWSGGGTVINHHTNTNLFKIGWIYNYHIEHIEIRDKNLAQRTQGSAFYCDRQSGTGNIKLSMTNCIISGFYDCVYMNRGIFSRFEQCRFGEAKRDGFHMAVDYFSSGTSCTFDDCYFVSNVRNGAYIEGMHYTTFSNCSSDNNGSNGYEIAMKIGSGGQARIPNNTGFYNCGAEANVETGYKLTDRVRSTIFSNCSVTTSVVGFDICEQCTGVEMIQPHANFTDTGILINSTKTNTVRIINPYLKNNGTDIDGEDYTLVDNVFKTPNIAFEPKCMNMNSSGILNLYQKEWTVIKLTASVPYAPYNKMNEIINENGQKLVFLFETEFTLDLDGSEGGNLRGNGGVDKTYQANETAIGYYDGSNYWFQ